MVQQQPASDQRRSVVRFASQTDGGAGASEMVEQGKPNKKGAERKALLIAIGPHRTGEGRGGEEPAKDRGYQNQKDRKQKPADRQNTKEEDQSLEEIAQKEEVHRQ